MKVITAIRNQELDQAFVGWARGFTAPVSRTFRGTMRRVMGLAPIVVQQIFQVIRDINQDGITILLVEQNAKKALQIADYAYVIMGL